MIEDPIVEEVRRYRAERSAAFNHDIKAMFADIQEFEKTSGHTYVTVHPDGTRTYTRYGKDVTAEMLSESSAR